MKFNTYVEIDDNNSELCSYDCCFLHQSYRATYCTLFESTHTTGLSQLWTDEGECYSKRCQRCIDKYGR